MFSLHFIDEVITSLYDVEHQDIEMVVDVLAKVRDKFGRVFIIGSGGGAGHASHAVCDFRKLCNIEAYAPYDNISELTARTNDEGYETSIVEYLKVSRFNHNDCLMVISVGGGTDEVSKNISNALEHVYAQRGSIVGIVGPNGELLV